MIKKFFYSLKIMWKLNFLGMCTVLFLSVFSASLSAGSLFFLRVVMQRLNALSDNFFRENIDVLITGGILFMLIPIAEKLKTVYTEKLAIDINEKINAAIFQKADRLYGLKHFNDNNYFVLIEKLNLGDFVIENYLLALHPLITLLLSTVAILLLFSFITPITIISLIPINIPIFFLERKIAKIKKDEIRESRLYSARLNYYYKTSIDARAVKDLCLFNFKNLFMRKMNDCYSALSKIHHKTTSAQIKLQAAVFITRSAFSILIFYFFTIPLKTAELPIATLILMLGVFFQLATNISRIGFFWVYVQKELDYFSAYTEFMNLQSLQNGDKKVSAIESIEFKNVCFSYNDTEILKNCSFKLSGGKAYALAGENGSGKSTIVKLILRFYEPSSGEILINGIPIHELDITSYRKQVSVIFQSFMKYGLSLNDNIFANAPPDKKFSGIGFLTNLINKLPEKEHTQLNMGFGGYDISGGEWQRVAILRSLNKPYAFFIADEPTANIDPIEEYKVFTNIIKNTSGIRLIITHRMGSIKDCDEILVLHGGKIEADGTHPQLMAQSEYYASLYNSQKEMYTIEGDYEKTV